MINAVLYSDQVIPENKKVDEHLVALMKPRGRRIGYIPSGPDPDLRYFSEKQRYYAGLGLDLDIYHDLDDTHEQNVIEALLDCDAIHLSGGATGAFLNRMKSSGMLEILGKWARSGGLLVGTSAGAMLMTPTIAVDALFSQKQPEDVSDGAALNLVSFEFFPHLNGKAGYLPDLLKYSRLSSRHIAACPDGDGIVISNGRIESVGNVVWMSNGRIVEAQEQIS